MTPGAKTPGVAVASKVDNGAEATKTLDAVRTALPALLGMVNSGAPAPVAKRVPLAGGVEGWSIPITKGQRVVYGVDGNLAIIGSSVPAVTAVQRPTSPLSSSADFQAGTSGIPGEVASLVWVNVDEALAAAQKSGALTGMDAKSLAQLRPVKSVTGWTTAGDTPTFEVYVRIAA